MNSRKLKLITLFVLIIISLQFSPTTQSNPAGDNIIITEVLYDTPGTDSVEEWIELFNPTESLVDLTGWTIQDNVNTFVLSGSIAPNGYLVVAKDNEGFYNIYGYYPDISGMTLALGNTGDYVFLNSSDTSNVDIVAWENALSGWDIYTIGHSSIRRTTDIDTDSVDDWEISGDYGSPGSGTYGTPDDTPPTVEILEPLNGSTVSRFVDIVINATDDRGVVGYEIWIDGGLEATASTYVWDSRNVNNGTHEICAKARDAYGNFGSHNITVLVDNDDTVSGEELIKIMTYNVEESGDDPDWKEVVKEENPDIVVFVETGTWDDGGDTLLDQYTDEFNTYFTDEEPYESYTSQGVGFSTTGEAIMSRYPILENVQIPEVPLDNGTMYDVTHDFMFWNVNISGLEVYIIGSHLKCCSGAENEQRREYETEGIINYMDGLGEHPIIYMGDLNTFSPEDTGPLAPSGDLGYGPLTMMLDPDDPTYGQYASEEHNFTDVYRSLNPTTPGYTYPGYSSRIDFIIVNDFFVDYLINSTVGDTASADIASDHYSVDFFFNAYAMVNEIDIVAPAEVQGLDYVIVSLSEVDLFWDSNVESDLDYYRVYRDGVNIANTTETVYSDSGLSPGIWYDYEVTAVDVNGNEGIPSDTVSVRTDYVVPEFPVIGITILFLIGVSALISTIISKRK